MKRITMLVPDTIRVTHGGSGSCTTRDVPVSVELVAKALELVDYHERYSFGQGSVFVERIENVDDNPSEEKEAKSWTEA